MRLIELIKLNLTFFFLPFFSRMSDRVKDWTLSSMDGILTPVRVLVSKSRMKVAMQAAMAWLHGKRVSVHERERQEV